MSKPDPPNPDPENPPAKSKRSWAWLVVRLVLLIVLAVVGWLAFKEHTVMEQWKGAYAYLNAEFNKKESALPKEVARRLGREPLRRDLTTARLTEVYEWRGRLRHYCITVKYQFGERADSVEIEEVAPSAYPSWEPPPAPAD